MLQMDWVKKHVKFCFHSNPHITSEVSQTDWSNRAFRQWVRKMVRNKIICKPLEQSIIQSITFDPMSHQHVASDAAALVLDALPGRPSPVAYRTSNGKLYWDLSYILMSYREVGRPDKLQAHQTHWGDGDKGSSRAFGRGFPLQKEIHEATNLQSPAARVFF